MKRRRFLTSVLKTGALVSLSPRLAFADNFDLQIPSCSTQMNADDHFFLFITLPNPSGCDASYLFDARPLDMTAKNLIQNYRAPSEPTPFVGRNGTPTLATDLVSALMPLKSYFSVINGVRMSTVDGHDQNTNFLFTGDTSGGPSFIPNLNRTALESRPLDILERGRIRLTSNNSERSVPLSPKSAAALVKTLKTIPPLDASTELFQHLSQRMSEAATLSTNGSFSAGASMMQKGFSQAPALSQMIVSVKVSEDDTNLNFVSMLREFFKEGAAKSAILSLDFANETFDTHDTKSAQRQPLLYNQLANSLAEIIKALRDTAFDEKRSLMDVTTFMFSAEFSRSMRQGQRPVQDSGTDHNQHCNSMIIGGRGIVCEQIFGSTDFQTADEILSPAHLSLDPGKYRIFGRPFDFKTFQPRTDLPPGPNAADYIGCSSVINTIYSLFGVSEDQWRLIERNAPKAPVLRPLLA